MMTPLTMRGIPDPEKESENWRWRQRHGRHQHISREQDISKVPVRALFCRVRKHGGGRWEHVRVKNGSGPQIVS